MTRLRTCGCGADFLPRKTTSRFCSRRCASLDQQARRRREARPAAAPLGQKHYLVLRLLKSQPLERRARGGWRFGTMTIGETIVARLIASGRAEVRGEHVFRTQRREGTR